MSVSGRLSRRGLIAGAGLALSGCGFHPVYGGDGGSGGAAHDLETVDVGLIPNRSGQLVRQALQQRFYGTGDDAPAKRYQLVVSFGVAGAAIGEQSDSSITRLRQFGSANWTLKRLDPAETTVAHGLVRSLDGVNIIDQQYFSSDIEGETVARRMAENIADQITLQVAAYFNRQRATPPG